MFGFNKVSEGVNLFSKSIIDNYKDWKQDGHSLTNTKTGLSIWTANGIGFLRIRGQNEGFWNTAERKHIYQAILKVIRLQIEEKGTMD